MSGPLELVLDGGRNAFLPGGTLTGRVAWSLEGPASAMELRLFWHTAGKGTRDLEIVQTLRFEGAAHGEREFSMTLPRFPYSYSGNLVSILWDLEAVAEPGGTSCAVRIVISPTGREIAPP